MSLRAVLVNQETSIPESRDVQVTAPGWGWRFLELISAKEDGGDLSLTINRLLGLAICGYAEVHGVFVDATGQRN